MIVDSAKSFHIQSWLPDILSPYGNAFDLATQKLLTLCLVALASLILGMGVPVTASYLILAVLVVPAFGNLGVSAIAAHMAIYWLSQDSNITPPVCVAAYAGAAIAKSDPWKTGWCAFRYAKMLYVVPLLFIFFPEILLEGEWYQIVICYLGAIAGTLCFAAFIQGYLFDRLFGLRRFLVALSCVCFYLGQWQSFLLASLTILVLYRAALRPSTVKTDK